MLLHVSGTVVAPQYLMQGSSPFTVMKNIFRDNSNERLIGQISPYKIQTTGKYKHVSQVLLINKHLRVYYPFPQLSSFVSENKTPEDGF